MADLDTIERAARRALIPPPKLRLSDWTEQHMRLPAGVTATPGRVQLWEFQKAICDSIGDPTVQRVSVLKAVRCGYSTLLVAAVGAYVSNDPAPVICLVPTEADARNFMVHAVEPIAEATPALAGLFADDTAERNTILAKRFPGGSLKVIAARAPRNLRAHTAKVLLADEIDAMEISAEGSPVLLAEKRTLSYPDRKIVVGSTPTVAETSLIIRAYEASDMRVFECRCVECGEFAEVLWKDIRWEPERPETANWCCPHCGSIVEERHKPTMVANGRWRATRPEIVGHHGYKLNALISLMPNASWSNLAREFLQAKDDPDQLKVFVNTLLAEPWKESADDLDESELASRVEPFSLDDLPPETLFITAGTDLQDDRTETVILGHSRDATFVLAYETIWGRPDSNDTWAELDDLLRRNFRHPHGGLIGIDAAAIDAGDGEWMDAVMKFTRPRFGRRVVALKGVSGNRPLLVASATRGSRLFICGVDGAKATIMNKLKSGQTIRFSNTLPARYFDELASERRILKYSRGVPTRIWERITGRRAEGLDATCYALAARTLIAANPDRREEELSSPVLPKRPPAVVRSAWLGR